MPTSKPPSEWSWLKMTEMEQMVWATAFALAVNSPSGGAQSADQAVERLRILGTEGRSAHPEPEYEAARAGHHIERSDFDIWYRVATLIRHGNERSFREPTQDDCAKAYERFQLGRNDFY